MAKVAPRYVRQAGVAMLRRHAALEGAPIAAASIFPEQRPAGTPWPFVAWGLPITGPFLASGLDGSSTSVAVHAYAETTGEGDDTVAGFDAASDLIAWVVAVLGGEEGAEVSLADTDCPYPATAYIHWTGSQVVQDGADASAFHAFATFDISVSS